MTATQHPHQMAGATTRPVSTRFGYVVAIVINAVMLVVVNNILEWGWAPFLTDDFAELVWILDLSFLGTIVVNAIYLGYDPPWFKSASQIVLSFISMAVAIRTFQVFPFDFSGYQFNWEPLARFVIVLTMVAVGISIVVETAKLVRSAATHPE
ncbi:MAG TPA: hypothetical protein VFL72_01755 [Acidimicrobiia bacterium]|nr:hypothetical protein [Acidimicrobiia bacterium]